MQARLERVFGKVQSVVFIRVWSVGGGGGYNPLDVILRVRQEN